jgi:hypothetical protein
MKKGDRVRLKTDATAGGGFDYKKGAIGYIVSLNPPYASWQDLVEVNFYGYKRTLIVVTHRLEIIEEENMEKFKEQLELTYHSMNKLAEEYEKLTNHEKATVGQVEVETDFYEVSDLDDIVPGFERFKSQLEDIYIIDGYTVFINNYSEMVVIIGNDDVVVNELSQLRYLKNKKLTNESIKKLTNFYIDKLS